MGIFKSLGPLEIFLILLIVLVIFGAGRLPEIGSGMGKAMKSFKDAISGKESEKDKAEVAQVASTATAPAKPTETNKPA
jgi:sec-independent protein translocase protein TatA